MQTQPFSFVVPDHGASCSYTDMNSDTASPVPDICSVGAAVTSSSASREGAASSSVVWRDDSEVEKQGRGVMKSPR